MENIFFITLCNFICFLGGALVFKIATQKEQVPIKRKMITLNPLKIHKNIQEKKEQERELAIKRKQQEELFKYNYG